MNRNVSFTASLDYAALGDRLREVGIVLLRCDETGALATRGRRREWLTDLFVRSPLFRRLLRGAAERWDKHGAETFEVTEGVWLAPVPMLSRRRVVGWSVAVIVTAQLLENERLHAMCQSAALDVRLVCRLLADLPPTADVDVPRLARLAELAHADAEHMAADSRAMESVGRQLADSYEEMNLLYTIIQSMKAVQRPERFVTIVCEELLATLPYLWTGIGFVEDRSRLKQLAGRVICAGRPPEARDALRAELRRLLASADPEMPIVLDPARDPRHAEFTALGRNALAHPITSDGEVLGLLVAGDKEGEDPSASSVDIKLLGATASHAAIFLENAALYDDLNAMFVGTLEALTASIDAKDRYTCGHSHRVAQLTQQLARALGLDEQQISRTRIAGLVHDVGKIGVPERVLLKPGRLNEEEFAWIRRHPEIGYRILKDIPQLQDILPGVLHHHERWDGAGYPRRLRGEEIPFVARLITLADSFDAMSSTRTYRASMSRSDVLAEILHCAGSQFDPTLAPVFVNLDFAEFDRLVAEHRALERGRAA